MAWILNMHACIMAAVSTQHGPCYWEPGETNTRHMAFSSASSIIVTICILTFEEIWVNFCYRQRRNTTIHGFLSLSAVVYARLPVLDFDEF